MAAVYQRHDFLTERKEALDRWGGHVGEIVQAELRAADFLISGSKVRVLVRPPKLQTISWTYEVFPLNADLFAAFMYPVCPHISPLYEGEDRGERSS